MKLGYVVFEICKLTDIQTDRQTDRDRQTYSEMVMLIKILRLRGRVITLFTSFYLYIQSTYYRFACNNNRFMAPWTVSGTTWISRYQKGKTRNVKPIWIYWSKR